MAPPGSWQGEHQPREGEDPRHSRGPCKRRKRNVSFLGGSVKHELEFCEVFTWIYSCYSRNRSRQASRDVREWVGSPLHLYVKLYVSLGYHPHGGAVVRVPISMCAWICSLLCPRVFLPLLMWPAKATCNRCGLSFLVRLGLSDTMSAQPLRRHHSPSAT